MAAVDDMMAAQTSGGERGRLRRYEAGGTAIRCPVMITGMRQVGTVNFRLLVEFDLTVTPEGMAPSAMRGE